MKIAVIGGGFAGLSAAYYLSKKGHKVTIFEKNNYLGGVASGFKENNWQWSLDFYYHHFFANDKSVKKICKELNIEKKLFFNSPITSIFYKKSINQFDTPLSLLSFPHLSLFDKLRVGLTLLFLKLSPPFKLLEKTTAYNFLQKAIGKKNFEILFKPLFVNKFGPFSDKVNALWFWARIKKRTKKLGYFVGGFRALIDTLVNHLKDNGVKIYLNKEVKEIKKNNLQFTIYNLQYDAVIAACPTPVFLRIAPFLPKDYTSQLSQISHLSSLSLILATDKPLLEKTYWLNINDTSFPFVSLVEHTNFVDKKYYGNQYITYIGNYLPQNHPFLKKSKEELLKIFLPYLKKIVLSPKFSVLSSWLFQDKYAQTVVPINYSAIKPAIETPIRNLYLLNIDVIYPWDRGVNYAIELGEKVARKISIHQNE